MKKNDIVWSRIEDLTLRSFRGEKLSDEEFKILKIAYDTDPKKYVLVTNAVRNEERNRIKFF